MEPDPACGIPSREYPASQVVHSRPQVSPAPGLTGISVQCHPVLSTADGPIFVRNVEAGGSNPLTSTREDPGQQGLVRTVTGRIALYMPPESPDVDDPVSYDREASEDLLRRLFDEGYPVGEANEAEDGNP